ncbi:hypothetical protein BH09GEM1_BH09GEM1_19890 [soil metagenome]
MAWWPTSCARLRSATWKVSRKKPPRCYEDAFSQALASGSELPSFLVGRLATLYRRLGRFDDEIYLLERFRDSLVNDDLQARYRARLTKAQALAAQHRMSDSVALASVRASRERSIGKRRIRRSQAGADAALRLPGLPAAL